MRSQLGLGSSILESVTVGFAWCVCLQQHQCYELTVGVCQPHQHPAPLALLLLPSSCKSSSTLAGKQASTASCALQVCEAGLQPLVEWQGHELEAWMAHWDRHQVRAAAFYDTCYVVCYFYCHMGMHVIEWDVHNAAGGLYGALGEAPGTSSSM
jgi:hypothetical protein